MRTVLKYLARVTDFRLIGVALFLALILSAWVPASRAQQVSGLTGLVSDASGASVPGVTVRLENKLTGASYTATTDETGRYIFAKLPPGGGYRLTFAKDSFRTLVLEDVSLGVGSTETRDVAMEVGQITQTVEVKAVSTTVNTTDASVGNVLASDILHSLPILIRESPATLLGLQAGVVANSANSGTGTDFNRNGAITGSRTDQGNVTIDGIDVNDQAGGFAFATVANAPIDSIQEFRTITAVQDAGEGRSAGGQVLLTTKGGTNTFHGSAYEYNRTAATAANDFFNNRIGVKRPALTRNQFGGTIGGPVKKDKLFFFFNYEGRRDARASAVSRTVPLDQDRNGSLAYIHTGTDASGAACTRLARLNNPTTAQCITVLTPAQVAAIDPQGVGANAALQTVINNRYPHANDLTGGNGVTTGLFRFNAPIRVDHNTYVARMDYKINSKQSLFGRFNIVRESDTQVVQQFPGDPPAQTFADRDYSYVIGHTWTRNENNINSLTFGMTRQFNDFPQTPNAFPTFPNEFTYGPYSGAFFNNFNIQSRTVPVPTIRDDYTLIKGKHQMAFGVNIRPIHNKTSLTNDFNFIGIGIGGNLPNLDSSTRPNDILNSTTVHTEWDAAFPFLLGRFSNQTTNFNYTQSLQPEPPGSGLRRNFHYNEFEGYWQDSWRPRNDLTITYGVRWSYYSVPFEADGFETVPSIGPDALFSARVLAGQQGIGGDSAAPFLTYDLGGKANHTPGYFQPTLTNFGPRLSFAWSPSFREGFLSKAFGDRKTVIRAGGAEVYDRVASTVTFIADQVGFLFDNTTSTNFGEATATGSLQNDPRFTSLTSTPIASTPPVQTRPVIPFVQNGVPFGEAAGQFIYAADPNFKTPYEIVADFGIQRELPGNMLLEVDYVGRFGRRLFVQADAAQIVDFKDLASGQTLITAFNNISTALRNGTAVTPQQFFENQVGPGATAFLASVLGTTIQIGDLSDFVQALNANGLLASNIGLDGQSATIAYVASKGSSNYNGLLTTLTKRFSHGLQMHFNYTFSHSIDNSSTVVNTVAGGLVCDMRDMRVCRGNSDFDVKHVVVSDWVYDLPFGRSGYIGKDMPGWADRIVGGWHLSGIWSWRSGFAFGTTTGAFPVGFNFNSPGVLVGSSSALSTSIHTDPASKTIQLFKDPTAAQGAFANAFGGEIGNRNDLRGPHFWNIDASVLKDIKLPRTETMKLVLRADAFNLFNHENFQLPSASAGNININGGTFGQITTTQGAARQLQISLRFEF